MDKNKNYDSIFEFSVQRNKRVMCSPVVYKEEIEQKGDVFEWQEDPYIERYHDFDE